MFSYNKIIIIGCAGSGKSTFSRKLAKILNIPLYHLDSIYWNEDGSHIDRPAFRAIQSDVMNGEQWIIDGHFRNTLEMRISQCDLIYFFDIPTQVCINGAMNRGERAEMPCKLPVDEELIHFIKNFNTERKPQLIEYFNKYSDKKVITFKSHNDVDNYLTELKNSFEFWDVYDENRNLTGEKISRYDYFYADKNVYHLAVHIWIKNSKGEWLISKRTANKSQPLLWECTGGSVLAGENSLQGALREVNEELGLVLNKDKGFLYKSLKRPIHPDFCDVWVFEHDCDISEIVLQDGETCDAMWASDEKIKALIDENKFISLEHMQYVYDLIGYKK